jgi:hypothetical protein
MSLVTACDLAQAATEGSKAKGGLVGIMIDSSRITVLMISPQLVLQRLRQRASNAMLSIARRPSANAAKAAERIRQEHEQDDLLHLANRTQLRRVTLTSPAISTPTLATGTSGSLTPPGPPSVMATIDGGANGLMWNSMPDVGERRDRNEMDGNSPRPHVNAAYNGNTNTSISPADAFRAGPSRPTEGPGSRETQQRRAFRALPRSQGVTTDQHDSTAERMRSVYQQADDGQIRQASGTTHPGLSNGVRSNHGEDSSHATHEYQRTNMFDRLPVNAEGRGRSRGVLPFEHMNAFGMPMGMDPTNLNINSRNHSQSGHHMFSGVQDPSEDHGLAHSSVIQGMATHHRGFTYPSTSAQQAAEMLPSDSRQTDTFLYQQPSSTSHPAYDTQSGDRSTRGYHSLAHPTMFRDHADFTASGLTLDMDARMRAMGDMNTLSEMHSLEPIDMEIGGMDMDMPLLPPGGSLHDVEQFIAGWHDQ